MNISPSVTETVSLSASAGALELGAVEVGAVEVGAEELASALLAGAASVVPVAASSEEHPLTRPIPRTRTNGAARRAERVGPVGWDTQDLLGATATPPRRRLPVAPDAAAVKHLAEPP
jgi:hypothetical protein